MEVTDFIVQNFDIRKLRAGCNVRDCKKLPTKELLLIEFNKRKPVRKVASIYMCEKHCTEHAKTIPKELEKTSDGKRIGGRIYNINQVTH